MKTLRHILCILLLCVGFSSSVNAQNIVDNDIPIDVKVNDIAIKMDVNSFIQGGTTYVPTRFVSEALGTTDIIWNEKNSTVTILTETDEIVFTIGKKQALVNGKSIALSGSAKIVNNRCFVPVRFIAEKLGAIVKWDGTYYTVNIQKENIEVPSYLHNTNYNEEDIFWLSRIIESESGGEVLKGKIAVGNVILNRVKSPSYPNTIYDVIFDRNYGVQFQPVMNGTIYNKPSYVSIVAAKRALVGEDVVGSSLYFLNPRIATSFWITENRPFYLTIGNHDFYL